MKIIIDKIILRILKIGLNIVYFFMKIFPTKNRVVMISRQSNAITIDFQLLKDELSKKYEVKCLCKKLEGKENSKFKERIKYGFHMFAQMYYLATSKVCILDSYCPTVSILKHKKKLKIVQIWHSIGTMKRFGYTALNKEEGTDPGIARIMKMHQNYDLVFASGHAYIDHLAAGFNVDPKIIEVYTLPRIDLLSDKKYEKDIKNKLYKKYPKLKNNKKNIIYAPTFRKEEDEFLIKLKELIDEFDYSKYNLIVKLHPLSTIIIDNENVIFDKDFSTFDFLFVADGLISDYSCVLYEAGVRNIPLYFYCYDIDDYLDTRGIALDYKELPGYQEKSAKKLVKELDKKYDLLYLKKFIKKYVENSKNCTKKMAERIEKYL